VASPLSGTNLVDMCNVTVLCILILKWLHLVERFLFIYLVCEAIGTTATAGQLCQPRVIVKMIMEKQIKCILAGETEVLGGNLPQLHFCPPQNST
jgi:hypothetical protein